MSGKITDVIKSPEEQRELFLWKYHDVSRDEVQDLLNDFKKFMKPDNPELEEDAAMRMFEKRGSVKTGKELREMVQKMDQNKNHHLSFLEWLCHKYDKNFEDLNDFVDEEAREKAMQQMRDALEEQKKIEEEILAAERKKELEAEARAAALEEESKLSGVAGMRAFFFRQVESAGDSTKTNEERIKEEAAKRKALREAKKKALEAQNSFKKESVEDLERKVRLEAEKKAAEEAEAIRKATEDEKAARAKRKAELNAKWEKN